MILLICLFFFFPVQYGHRFLYFIDLKESAFVVTDFLFLFSVSSVSTLTHYFPFCTHFGFHLLVFVF